MEEKKNHTNGEGKSGKSRHHRRGYFIQPADQKQEVTLKEVKTGEAVASNPASGEANNGHKHNHNRKKHHGRNNQTGGSQANQSQQPNTEEKREATAPEQRKNNNNNHNKNKHKHKSANQNAAPTPQDKVQESPEMQKKNVPEKSSKPERPQINHNPNDYEAYRWFVEEERDDDAVDTQEEAVPTVEVVGIRFKSTGKTYYFDPNGKKYQKGTGAIVDTARGQEFGEVAMANSQVKESDIVPPLRHVIRAATEADVAHNIENKKKEEEAFRVCNERIASHKLDMKLIEAQYTFDNTKLLFYFTSSDRVDFRELVKDLASVFRTRIELRQIGIRDEAKLMGGLGMCGRPLCCSVFLSDFNQVSIKMAKEQNLSLNSAKISGICGRLMCCLKYEHEAYEYEIKRTPPVDSLVRTESGDGIITETSPLAGTVKVRLFASPEAPPKVFKRDEIMMLRKKER